VPQVLEAACSFQISITRLPREKRYHLPTYPLIYHVDTKCEIELELLFLVSLK